jgi:predicted nucleic acid-binding protein
MKPAYVDSSALLAIAFGEPGAAAVQRRIEQCDGLYASNLLEAEVLSALLREGVEAPEVDLFAPLSWVLPDRPLTEEISRVLARGQLKGADLWHLACALYLSPSPEELSFLTLDASQRKVAARLGFRT